MKPPVGKWALDGNCRGLDPSIMVPENSHGTAEAKKICVGCTVKAQCLEYALENREHHGVWGGTSERDRRRILRQRRINAAMRATG